MKSLRLALLALPSIYLACSPLPSVQLDSGTTGTGGSSTTGAGGSASGGTTGTGGSASGGTTGTGGSASGGAGGAAGSAADAGTDSGAGGAGNPIADQIKTALTAANKWVLPCGTNQSYSDLVCINNPMNKACPLPPGNPTLQQYVFANTQNRNDMITLPGTAADGVFNVTARFQGVVEPKHYQRCTNAAPVAGSTTTNNGFCVGGEPLYTGNYNVYMIWASAPTPAPTLHNNAGAALAGQYYWLNNINKTEAHFSYLIDYTVTFQVQAGAMMQFLADDSNCSAIRNCDITSLDQAGGQGRCDELTVPNMPAGAGITQPYNGQFIIMTVQSVTKAP